MSATPATDSPSRWDMSNVYSGFDGTDYKTAFSQLETDIAEIEKFFDAHGIRKLDATPTADAALVNVVDEVLRRTNDLMRLSSTLSAFVYAFYTTDSYDQTAQRELSKLEQIEVRESKLGVRLKAWIGSLGPVLPKIIEQSEWAREHEFFLTFTAEQSKFMMAEELEGLAAELGVDGASAFGKLQGTVTSQLKVPFQRDGKTEMLPITVVQNYRTDGDPGTRRRAYQAEIEGWKSVRTTVAACLNSVKGTAITLAKRRGRASVLDHALEQNRIDRPTLDALMGAIREYFPVFRRYLKSKAAKLQISKLAWWDIFAPVGESNKRYSWRESRDFIVDKFGQFAAELGTYGATAFDDHWIDGEPREGKRGGAFCMPVIGVEQSRILANFDGSIDQVSTLAHELGHGFHNHCQAGLPALLRGAPSTLAETASIFCETLVAEAALKTADDAEKLAILEAQIAGATQVCLDISSRFIFENAVFERRENSELTADEFCELMLDAQKQTYGDAIDAETYHPYMWLWKPHYYSAGHNFYNFPYAFGHLFGLGLYAVYQQEGESFIPRYKELLRATAQDWAAPLAKRFGIDIATPDFWRGSLKVIEAQVAAYEKL